MAKGRYRVEVLQSRIARYRKSKDAKDFEEIIAKTDNLIIYTIRKLKKRRSYLKLIDDLELYQTGIIGLHNAITKMPLDEEAGKIPAWIVSYIAAVLRKTFDYADRERVGLADDGFLRTMAVPELCVAKQRPPELLCLDYERLVELGRLTDREERIVRFRVLDSWSIKEVAAFEHLAISTVSNCFRSGIAKLRKVLKNCF